MPYILKMDHISKEFPGVKALDDVSFSLRAGEVHALIGENGAGKSTLMKILTGIYKPDRGVVTFHGAPLKPSGPRDSQDKGNSMIHQELNLIPHLTVAENIFISREPKKLKHFLIDDRTMVQKTFELMQSLGLSIDPRVKVMNLSVAECQMVEIAKALVIQSEILVLDEPTSALSETEVQKLFEIIRRLKSQGVGIIYISHRLEEFNEIVDRVTVLRDGCYIETRDWKDTCIEQLITMMVGRSLENQYPKRTSQIGDVVLEAEHISRQKVLKDISFSVRSGEVLGIAGLMGAGRTELARVLFGADRIDEGKTYLHGHKVHIRSPHDAIRHGIAYLPEDRKKDGLFLGLQVDTNILVANLEAYSHTGVVDDRRCNEVVTQMVQDLDIKTPSPKQISKFLSGGNQQKVLIARWLCRQSSVIIFDEPTRGIDVGAKYEVYTLINEVAKQGAAVIMISSEMSEIIGMSDRIMVMCEGKKIGELDAAHATQERIMSMASGYAEEKI